MRIAYVVSRFPLVTETFILREFDALDRQPGVEVELYSLFPSADAVVHAAAEPWLRRVRRGSARRAVVALALWLAESPGMTLRLLGEVVANHRQSARAAVRALVTTAIALQHARDMRARGTTHIHAHFASHPALVAWVAARMTGVTFSVTPHAHDVFVSQVGLEPKLREAAGVVAVSQYNWMFLQHFGATPDRLWRIGYGLDLSDYAFRPRGMPESGRVDVLMVSSFKTYKGHRYLIEALVEPGLERLRIELIGDGPLRHEVERLAVARGVADRVTFAGSRDQAYVKARLAEADVLVQPSIVQADGDTEGLPNSLIEAAATGALMVGTRVTGVPELVVDGVTGFLADPASAESLADALRRALASGRASEQIVTAARRAVEEDHDLAAVVQRLGAAFAAISVGAEA